MTIICGATALYNHERWWLWGPRFPDCVKTPTSGLRVESLSRLRRIRKEPLWQSPSKEEKRENNSAHSLLVHVFTQSGPGADFAQPNYLVPAVADLPRRVADLF